METENQKSLGRKIKFGVIVSGLVVVGLAAGYVLGVYGYFKVIGPYVSEMKYKKFLEDYLKPYKEDFVGGNTPEETIDLFIAALKKGDYELASRYFEIKYQEDIKKKIMADKNNINQIIDELEYAKKSWHKEIHYEYSVEFWYNKEGVEVSRDIGLSKNMNNKWKIDTINIYYLAF
ncbi:hypothetical protein KJ575_02190 [Patescibacteria group bacterium]|nr:hypothetical protein [Patescibacteria group bacterium]